MTDTLQEAKQALAPLHVLTEHFDFPARYYVTVDVNNITFTGTGDTANAALVDMYLNDFGGAAGIQEALNYHPTGEAQIDEPFDPEDDAPTADPFVVDYGDGLLTPQYDLLT